MEFSEKYRLEKRLGSQRKRKFGELFLATDTQNEQPVVLKAVRKDENDASIVERLRAESSFSFDFKGLPKTLILEESASSVFLVRKFVNGLPLDAHWKMLKRKKRLPFLIEFLEKLSPIFDHLQQLGIVHCDIKPSNILIEKQFDEFDVHLLDFGLSLKTFELEENRKRKLLFPLGYAAPELLLNHLDIVDQRTDIFALGVVFWRLFAGHLPLVHPNPSIFTNLQLTHPIPEHSEISKKLHSVFHKMAYKHQFNLPPNRMEEVQVKIDLRDAMNKIYASIDEVRDSLQATAIKKFWS